MRRSTLLLAAALACTSCGGKAIVDPPDASTGGTGGTGGAGGSGGATTSSTSTGCVPKTCADLPCGLEAPDGCGGMIFCGCDGCSQTRGPFDIISVGTAESNRLWEEPTNAILSDDNYATITAMVEDDVSDLLLAWELEFDLPPDAFVAGIEARVERRALGGGAGLVDHQVSLAVAGSIATENKALPGVWSANEETITYGGPDDLWGTATTVDDVMSPDFGLAFAVRYDNTAGNDWPRVDAVTLTVHYFSDGCPE